MRVADLRPLSVFDGLSDDQLAELIDGGSEVVIEPGVALFNEGDRAEFWWVLIDGALDLTRHVGREDSVVGKMDTPGRWAGGFRAWDERGVYLATGRGVAAGRMLRVPAGVLRDRIKSWFPFGGHLIDGVFGTARAIEATVRQREALVTLGTLAAGLAHEINNPAAAATRAVADLEDACGTLVSSVDLLVGGDLSLAQFGALENLRAEIKPREQPLGALAMTDLEDELSSWLEDHDVARDWTIAPALAAAGVDPHWCERAATVLDGPALQAGLEWVASTVSVVGLISEVKDSVRRISGLVGAVRSYSQMDRASMQHMSLRDGLESTLVMLGHKVPPAVQVVRDYGADVPKIDAYAGELNQVWTNLIDNALDAMDGRGTLRVATRPDGDAVLVEICDTGAGMTAVVAERAFDAFFTTKEVGEGTGLGLDIARRIVVERHGGTINIVSRPGQTVLSVRLPVRALL